MLTEDGKVGADRQLFDRHYTGFNSMFEGEDDIDVEFAEDLSWPEAEVVDDEGFHRE